MTPIPSKYNISADITEVISRLGEDVNALNESTILITGGTGFFGRWLLQILCTLISVKQFKLEIYVVTRNPKQFLEINSEYPFNQNINFICGDIANFKLPNIKID
jgi:nucleoside-diphosphate-sugar epimerase